MQDLNPIWTMAAQRGGYEVGARGGRYRERAHYAQRYGARYGARYGVGQTTAAAPTATPIQPKNGASAQVKGENCIIRTSDCFAGHGRAWYPDHQYSCEVKPPRCNCHVIGANTLNDPNLPTGVPSLGTWTVTVDSGDASFFVPYYIFIQAFETGAVANLAITGAPLPTILQDSLSGREPNLRRADTTDPSFGIITTVYGQEKEIECVDWDKFASVNNQQLTLTGQNIRDVSVHVFVNIWGLAAA